MKEDKRYKVKKNTSAEIIKKYAGKRNLKIAEAEIKKFEVHAKVPEIFDIDKKLASTALEIYKIAVSGEDVENRLNVLREENKKLIADKRRLLRENGYDEYYTDVRFDCDKCNDTGYIGTKVCECMRKELCLANFEASGIGKAAEKQTFDSFSFDYYEGDSLERIKTSYTLLKDYVEMFPEDEPRSFIFCGATGLGKTHLAVATAKSIIEKGYRVVFENATDIIRDYEAYRFKGTVTAEELDDRYLDSDLLIIDDLGSEPSNQFTTSVIFDLLSGRINNSKPFIITTNLNGAEIKKIYEDRITSRILSACRPFVFSGKDVRMQKVNER